MTKKSKNPNEKTTHFDWKYPTTIGGWQFPSTDMEVEDEYGNVRLKKVFLDPNTGRVYYKINDNIDDDRIRRVIPYHHGPEIIVTPHGNYQTTMDRNAPPLRLNTDINNLSESSDKSNDKSNVRQTELEPSAEEQEILNKQALLKAAGYNVPQNGSWDLWQEEAWKKINTRHKQYDNTLAGMFQGLMDNLKGENTYQVNPLDQGEVKPYDYNNIDLGKTRRSQSNAVKQWEGTYGPIVAMATLGPALFTETAATIAGMTGGALGGKAVDYASEKLTGDDFGTLVAKNTPLSPELAEYLNPGNFIGGYAGIRSAALGDALLTGVTGKSRNFMKPLVNKYLGTSYYDNFRPMGYKNLDSQGTSKGKQIKNFLIDFAKPTFLRNNVKDPNYVPKWVKNKNQMTVEEVFRNDAHRLSMGYEARKELLPDGKYHSLYVKKDDGTYDVDWDYINFVKQNYPLAGDIPLDINANLPSSIYYIHGNPSDGSVVANDLITGNGGLGSYTFNKASKLKPLNSATYPTGNPHLNATDLSTGTVTFTDKWDIQPFSDRRSVVPRLTNLATKAEAKNIPLISKMAHNLKFMEMTDALGGSPFIQKTVVPNQKIYWFKYTK